MTAKTRRTVRTWLFWGEAHVIIGKPPVKFVFPIDGTFAVVLCPDSIVQDIDVRCSRFEAGFHVIGFIA